MPFDSGGVWYNDNEDRGDVASAARTASGTGTAFSTADVNEVHGTLTVSAASGTSPTLDVRLETTADGTNYYTVGSWSQITSTATANAKVFGPVGDLSRWAWTIGGTTPSFTFTIDSSVDRDD